MKKIALIIAILAVAPLCMAQDNNSILYKRATDLFNAKKYAKAYPIFRQLAESGDKDAQFAVGHYFYFGLGVQEPNMNEAIKWYTKSAEQGQSDAQRFMGDYYYT